MLFFLMLPAHASDTKNFQTPALSPRYYCSMYSLVSGLRPQPAQSLRSDGRARRYR